jgi:hypothetical protein
VEELDEEYEDESGILIPDAADDGDGYEELEARTTTIYASRMKAIPSEQDKILCVASKSSS